MKKLKTRDSNIELLRILTMFMVLLVHTNFVVFDVPTFEDVHINSSISFLRYFLQVSTIICVDVFVLISGYFGIRFKVKSLASFLFQVCFFAILMFLTCVALGLQTFSFARFLKYCVFMQGWWFVLAYLGLYLLSPILNAFTDHATRKQFKYILLIFFTFQFINGWGYDLIIFNQGYSTTSFVGLYLLARYIKMYSPSIFNMSCKANFTIYLVLVFSVATILFSLNFFYNLRGLKLMNYNSPLIILIATYFLLAFSKLKIQSTVVNRIAKSCFAVYLFHCYPPILDKVYCVAIRNLNMTYDISHFICYTLITIVLVFFAAILLDQIRLYLWNNIFSRFCKDNFEIF